MKNILSSIAKANVGYVVLFTAFGGLLIILSGLMISIEEQNALIVKGYQFQQAYLSSLDSMQITSIFRYALLSAQMKLPLIGDNLLGIGLVMSYIGTFIAAAAVYLCRYWTSAQDKCFERFYLYQA
jgi:hypothetical protein